MNIRVITTIIAGVFTSAAVGQETSRVFFFASSDTVQEVQEVATLLRSIADIRRLFTYNAPRALVMRGTADQVGLAEWLVNTLETAQASAKLEYRMPSGSEDVVRVFYLAHTGTVQSLQE